MYLLIHKIYKFSCHFQFSRDIYWCCLQPVHVYKIIYLELKQGFGFNEVNKTMEITMEISMD